jgi:hypothetical protein
VRILLDQCVAKGFRLDLKNHRVRTAFEMGWGGLKNGALLAEAAKHFDAFITVDQNIRFQQNLSKLPLPVLILVSEENDREALKPFVPTLMRALDQLKGQPLLRIHLDGRIESVV